VNSEVKWMLNFEFCPDLSGLNGGKNTVFIFLTGLAKLYEKDTVNCFV